MNPAVKSPWPKYFKESEAHYLAVATSKLFYCLTLALFTNMALTDKMSTFLVYLLAHLEKMSLNALVPA